MWQLYAIIANDLIREWHNEADAEALVRAYRDNPDAVAEPSGPGLVRRLAAGGLRRVGSVSSWIALRASSTASRLEGEPA